jgi:hypothetical protein
MPNDTAADAVANTFSDGVKGVTLQTSTLIANSGIAARDVKGYSIQMRWGGKMQHVGELGQGDLRANIKEKLEKMCPQKGVGHEVCGNGKMEKIGPVGWDQKGWWVYGDAHLQIRPELVYWPIGFDGLREIFVSLLHSTT